jgi:hypothetical protein
LVPDAGAARRVRRLVVERCACDGVVVGTWCELIEWARRAYLLPEEADNWQAAFADALRTLDDAFWAESCKVAPAETAMAVERALTELVAATDPAQATLVPGMESLEARPRRHLADLVRLVSALDGRLPPELEAIRSLLAGDVTQGLRPVRVITAAGVPALTRWRAALVDKLNHDAGPGDAAEAELAGTLSAVLAPVDSAPGALGVLQTRLYEPAGEKAPLNGTVQWVGVRDFLQEAEVAAGMVQRMLGEDPSLRPMDIGLLLPDDFEYAIAVEDAFRLGGLALSGLPAERWRRDLGREAVFHFLYCRQKPAPAMALAVVLSSPLMPWSREDGAVLAQAVMDGNYELKVLKGATTESCAMLSLLQEGDTEPTTLREALSRFAGLLGGGEEFGAHVGQARQAVDELAGLLGTMRVIDWAGLRRAATPRLITSGDTQAFNLEGVTVWRAGQEPWRPVRRLIVLGFAQGRYPEALARNAVFSAEDLEQVQIHTGLPLENPSQALGQRRARLRRQLAAIGEAVTFLVPRRDPSGAAQSASESLVFMHQLFAGPESADELVVDLDAESGRARANGVAFAAPAPPAAPRMLVIEDLEFGRDLVALRKDAEGDPKPESPSSLETLMVSRLAWLLRRLDAEPIEWAPEAADPKLLGTVAHEVFEGLFGPGVPLPAREEVPERVERLVEDVLTRMAPFLRASRWTVERQHFTAQTVKAAQAWRDTVEQLGAEVIAAEEWLAGEWSGIRIHGQTDLILGLPGKRLLVVDYKRSSSRKRLTQMQRGFDSQASLYRAMLSSGGPKDPNKAELAARLRAANETGVVYYLMNDRVAVSDSALPGAAAIPSWRTVDGDIAGQALAAIAQRLAEVRCGRLRLNRVSDRQYFEKEAGITPYALDESPLIAAYTLPDDEGEP